MSFLDSVSQPEYVESNLDNMSDSSCASSQGAASNLSDASTAY